MSIQEEDSPTRNGGVYRRIAALARTLQDDAQDDAETPFQRIVDSAATEIPGAEYAGITLATADIGVQTPAATHPYAAILDALQQRHQQGPCLEAAWHQHAIRINDLATERRWPYYVHDVLKVTPIRSILSFQLFTTEQSMGALNVYSTQPNALDHTAEEVGYVLATHAALALQAAQREGQFQSALATRDVIGQAKGILMARFNITAVEAFELLKRLSQERNTKLVDIARQIANFKNFDGI